MTLQYDNFTRAQMHRFSQDFSTNFRADFRMDFRVTFSYFGARRPQFLSQRGGLPDWGGRQRLPSPSAKISAGIPSKLKVIILEIWLRLLIQPPSR